MLFFKTLLTPRLLHSDFRKLRLFLTYMSIYLTTQKQHRLIRLTGKEKGGVSKVIGTPPFSFF